MIIHRPSLSQRKRRSRTKLLAFIVFAVCCQLAVFLWHSHPYKVRFENIERIFHAGPNHNSTIIEAIWHHAESDHSGSFRVRFTAHPSRERDGGRPVLRIRVVGPQVKLLSAHRSNESLLEYIAPYFLECAGTYSFEITPLFEEFYDNDIARGKLLPQWPPYLETYKLEVKHSLPNCQLGREWRRKPLCNEQLMRLGGSWVIDDQGDYAPEAWSAQKIQNWLSRAKIFPDSRFMSAALFQRLLPGSVDHLWNSTEIPFGLLEKVFPRLKFRYFHCQPHNGAYLAEKCQIEAKGRPICLVGDSQTRFLHNGFVEIMEPNNTECSTVKNKEVCPTNLNLKYSVNCYGEYNVEQAESCGMVLLNFGQWPISWVEDRPFPASRYQEMVRKFLTSFAVIKDRPVYWLTTNTMALNGRIIGHLDWRHDPGIELYNRIANREAEAAGVPVIDIYGISSVLNDLSVDKSHYKAPVLTALVHAVATVACKVNESSKKP